MTQRRVFLVWLPLALMWVMMGVEQPAITAVIARLSEPALQLAAFGVTFSLALLIESPVIQLLSTGTALAVDRGHYRRILRYTHWMSGFLVLAHLIFAVTPLFDAVVGGVLGIPGPVLGPSRTAFLLMTPWSAAIAYRRFWQGVLIRYGRTSVVPVTMISRIVVIAIVLSVTMYTREINGAAAGALAMSCGVVAAAVTAFFFVRPVIRNEMPVESDEPPLTFRRFTTFYVPLALTSVVALAARPVLSFGIARAPHPVNSLAVWPVVMALAFVFNSMALAYQEVVISLSREENARDPLAAFAVKLGVVLTALLILVAVTPVRSWWFAQVAGLDETLRSYTRLPMLVLSVAPLFVTAVSWYRGRLVFRRRTFLITQAVLVNTTGLIGFVLVFGAVLPLPGVFSAACAFAAALAAETAFLRMRLGRARRKAARTLRRS